MSRNARMLVFIYPLTLKPPSVTGKLNFYTHIILNATFVAYASLRVKTNLGNVRMEMLINTKNYSKMNVDIYCKLKCT